MRPDSRAAGQGDHPGQDQVQPGIGRGAPARLNHGGAGVFQDDGGAVHGGAGAEVLAAIDRRVTVLAGHPDRGLRHRFGGAVVRVAADLGGLARAAGRLGLQRLDDQRLALGEEAEAAAVQGLEGGSHLVRRAEGHGQGRVGTRELDLGPGGDGDPVVGEALGRQFGPRLVRQRLDTHRHLVISGGLQRDRRRRLPDRPHLGQTHAIG